MQMTDRRKWYIGFGVVILGVIALLVLFHANHWWMWGFLIILAVIAVYDRLQTRHTILRNFPVLGHMRFILEFLRPEIQQYFVADDREEQPYDRDTRTVIYSRAKGVDDTRPFGTDRQILEVGYEWVAHSLAPRHLSEVEDRVMIGGPQCRHPYSASRLNVSAMSFGALSPNAIMALNQGAAKGGFYQNTGEGGLTEYHRQGGDVVFQLGTGYFSARKAESGRFDDEEFRKKALLPEVKMIELKLSQGAKPAHGGVLPAAKITPEIAKIRNVPMDQDVLSPPAHPEFSTPTGLCAFIDRLRGLADGKPVGFKLCVGKKREFMAICKGMIKTGVYPDFITVDGAEGGTGAAPLEYTDNVGMPLNDALIYVHNTLVGFGLRNRITLIASGKIATGFDMVRKIALGADACNCARGMMMSVGCIQSKQCNKNTCPVGVATQDPKLYRKLDIKDKSLRAYRFHEATIKSFRELIGAVGLTNPAELAAEHLLRRVGPDSIKNYAEIYEYLQEAVFLDDTTIPEAYRDYWERSSAESF